MIFADFNAERKFFFQLFFGCHDPQHIDIQPNDTQNNWRNSYNIFLVRFISILTVIMSIVILLSVIMLTVVLLSVFRQGVTLLSSIMLIVSLLCHSDNCLISQRCYSERNYTYCHFAECQSAERRFAGCHYPYCHFAYCHFAECHALCSLPSIMISVILQNVVMGVS
jgi:hypothetical protein